VKTGSNLAESSTEGCGSKSAVLPPMVIIILIARLSEFNIKTFSGPVHIEVCAAQFLFSGYATTATQNTKGNTKFGLNPPNISTCI
jgi:hypothetical protein